MTSSTSSQALVRNSFAPVLVVSLLVLSTSPLQAFDHEYADLDTYFGEVVKSGGVDYDAAKTKRVALDAYLDTVKALEKSTYQGWSKAQQIAFWTNTYNAIVIMTILDRDTFPGAGIKGLPFPRNSIQRIADVWAREHFPIVGEKGSLEHIEHGILRKEFEEPRVHFALNCASVSCPPLRAEAYTAEKLNAQLEEQTKQFIQNSEQGLRWESGKNRLFLSSIFKWYKEDYEPKTVWGAIPKADNVSGDFKPVFQFILQHADADLKSALESAPSVNVQYLSYDWSLNETK